MYYIFGIFMNKYWYISVVCFWVMICSGYIVNDQRESLPLRSKIKDILGRIFQSKLPLPQFLKKRFIEVKHIRSYAQRGGTCGWYAVLNACAIQELVEKNKEITADAIEEIVLRLITYIVVHQDAIATLIGRADLFYGLDIQQKNCLAEYFRLRNFYTLIVEGSYVYLWSAKKHVIGNITFDPEDHRFFSIKEIMTQLMQEKGVVKHFMLSSSASAYDDDYHAVLISYIKCPGKRPLIIYMDSNNVSLSQCSLDYATPFFVTKIISCLLDLPLYTF